ncbi:hypothetical protein Hamer_G029942, partial [Homarus americanus]
MKLLISFRSHQFLMRKLHTQHKQQLADISGIYQNILSVCLFDDRIDTETKKNMRYNESITQNEDQKQYILQVVAAHRKKFQRQAKLL